MNGSWSEWTSIVVESFRDKKNHIEGKTSDNMLMYVKKFWWNKSQDHQNWRLLLSLADSWTQPN
jgi:hypothetical protein